MCRMSVACTGRDGYRCYQRPISSTGVPARRASPASRFSRDGSARATPSAARVAGLSSIRRITAKHCQMKRCNTGTCNVAEGCKRSDKLATNQTRSAKRESNNPAVYEIQMTVTGNRQPSLTGAQQTPETITVRTQRSRWPVDVAAYPQGRSVLCTALARARLQIEALPARLLARFSEPVFSPQTGTLRQTRV